MINSIFSSSQKTPLTFSFIFDQRHLVKYIVLKNFSCGFRVKRAFFTSFILEFKGSILYLVLAWKFEAEMMCRFTRQEFLKGCKDNSHIARVILTLFS